jgi:hypothetical protein
MFSGLRVQALMDGSSLIASESGHRDVLFELPAVYGVKIDESGLSLFRGIQCVDEVLDVAWRQVESIELEDIVDRHWLRHSMTFLVTSRSGLAELPVVVLGAGPAGGVPPLETEDRRPQ